MKDIRVQGSYAIVKKFSILIYRIKVQYTNSIIKFLFSFLVSIVTTNQLFLEYEQIF